MRRGIPFIAIACALTLMALATPLLAARHPLVALAVRGFFSSVCHEDRARSLLVRGKPVAVCIRCLGIYLGGALGSAIGLARGTAERVNKVDVNQKTVRYALLSAALLNAFDWIAESLRWHGNQPFPRFLLGMSLGIAAGLLLTSEGTGASLPSSNREASSL
jgi:uncharacterized membrane protein